MEVFALQDRKGENAKHCQRCDFDQHKDGVEARALLGSDDQQDCDKAGDDRRRKIEDTPAERPRRERRWNDDSPALHQSDEVAGPADCDGGSADGIFENECPADHPREQLAHDGIGVGVGGAGDGNHRGELGIAERRHGADEALALHKLIELNKPERSDSRF